MKKELEAVFFSTETLISLHRKLANAVVGKRRAAEELDLAALIESWHREESIGSEIQGLYGERRRAVRRLKAILGTNGADGDLSKVFELLSEPYGRRLRILDGRLKVLRREAIRLNRSELKLNRGPFRYFPALPRLLHSPEVPDIASPIGPVRQKTKRLLVDQGA
jgi:hypothetical protein